MALVVVIIGLVTLGIMQAGTMVETMRLNRFISEIGKIESAAVTFRAKYGCVVGDCIKAKDFGLVPDSYTLFRTQSGTEGDPYNPNGDEKIGPSYDEGSVLIWTELQASGLYMNSISAGSDLYSSPYFETGKKSIIMDFPYVSDANNVMLTDTWVIMYSLEPDDEMASVCSGLTACPSFTPAQMFTIDKKRDDGKPRSGDFKASGGATFFGNWFDPEYSDPSTNVPASEDTAGNPSCLITGADEYNTSATGVQCLPFFKL